MKKPETARLRQKSHPHVQLVVDNTAGARQTDPGNFGRHNLDRSLFRNLSGLNLGKLISEEIVRGHQPAGGRFDQGEIANRDHCAIDPLRNQSLRDPDGNGELCLSAHNVDSTLNGLHSSEISGADSLRQENEQRRYWRSAAKLISVTNMERNKRSKPTAADLNAAKNLRKIWDGVPKERRPTQDDAAEALGVNQSAISQFRNGQIALHARAVLGFAQLLGCQPEEIRDDLPEIAAARAVIESQIRTANRVATPQAQYRTDLVLDEAHRVDAIWSGYSLETKKQILEMVRLAGGLGLVATPARKPKEQKAPLSNARRQQKQRKVGS